MATPTSSGDCLFILNTNGYSTTPERLTACETGAVGGWAAHAYCWAGLIGTGVNETVADLACEAAPD